MEQPLELSVQQQQHLALNGCPPGRFRKKSLMKKMKKNLHA
jgi:hypothetical protein